MNAKKTIKRTVVLKVLEDTGYAYTLESHINADYADYASTQALSSFQKALKKPHLTYEELCKMLRRASRRAGSRQCKTPWSMFMANYLSKHCNNNENSAAMH